MATSAFFARLVYLRVLIVQDGVRRLRA